MTLAPIQLRRNTSMYWASTNPMLVAGEPVYSTDTHTLKIGPGYWSDLPGFATVADVSDLKVLTDQLIAELADAGQSVAWYVEQAEAAFDAIAADNDVTVAEIKADNDATVAEVAVIRDGAVQAKTDAETAKAGADDAAALALAGQFAGAPLGSVNIDAVFAAGVYYQDNGANVTPVNGYPTTQGAGILRVHRRNSDNWVTQEYIALSTGSDTRSKGTWLRRRINGAWQSWQFSPSQRINNPGGQPGVEVLTWDDQNAREQGLLPIRTLLGTADLNAVTTPGFYDQINGLNATVARNYAPGTVGTGCELEVFGWSTGVIQRITPLSGGSFGRGFYQRRFNGAFWSAWVFVASQRVDETAGRAIYTWDDVNSREQLIYGDTGWRNVTSLLTGGATANSVEIRRVGGQLMARINTLKLADASIYDPFMAIPLGFRPDTFEYGILREQIATGAGFVFAYSADMRLYGNIAGTPNNTTHRFSGVLRGFTDQPWPTSLPGTAGGTIPNT